MSVDIMLYALGSDGKKILAMPKGKAVCPLCREDVIAKCGTLKANHWAHRHKMVCDPWFEETSWHISWKSLVLEEHTEVIMKHYGKTHRADIVGNHNTVIELQRSPISAETIHAREYFYENMIWVLDASTFFGNIVLNQKNDHAAMACYYPRSILSLARKPVYLHLPCGNIFRLIKVYPKVDNQPLRGWGRFIGWKPFFYRYLSGVVKHEYIDGEQPKILKNRMDITRIKYHNNLEMQGWYTIFGGEYGDRHYTKDIKLNTRCQCDISQEYPGCDTILNPLEYGPGTHHQLYTYSRVFE